MMNTNESGTIPQMAKVEITWLDAWSDEAHLEMDAPTNLAAVERQNIGYLIKDDEDKVIITQGTINNFFHEKVFVDGFVIIPRGVIQRVKVLDDPA